MNAQQTAPPLTSSSSILKSHSVLLIGVNEVDEMLLGYILELQGGESTFVGQSDQALEMLEERPYQLLFINTRLENTNALDLARRIRNRHGEELPIIGITSGDHHSRTLLDGFDYIIHRPIEKRKILRGLHQVMAKTK